ncbi:MAG: hypothetical protein K2N12_07950 [Helicobacter sp.]|nr:hypothetical protein [Helicobacter sp.]
MKIAIMCDSPLLEKCLEYYLRDFIVGYRQCDFVIADKNIDIAKPLCLISLSEDAAIIKPFTRTQLFLGVQKFFKSLRIKPSLREIDESHPDYPLKKKIEDLVAQFTDELYWAVSDHYEKR